MTALAEYPAREEEFGTRAQVLPLLSCTLALGTQIVAALRLRFRLRKSVRRVQARSIKRLFIDADIRLQSAKAPRFFTYTLRTIFG